MNAITILTNNVRQKYFFGRIIVYYNHYRYLQVKRNEFEQCWINRPVIVEFCSYYTDTDIHFLLDFQFNFSHHTYIEFNLDKLNNKVYLNNVAYKKQFYLIDNKTNTNKAYLSQDLLTLYYCLNNRTQSIKINKNYAKQLILDILNDEWDYFKNRDKDSLYKKIIEIYFYLTMNIYVFNIYHQTDYKLLLDINKNYNVLMNDLTLMYNKITNAIDKL